jgi:hypothetical protein
MKRNEVLFNRFSKNLKIIKEVLSIEFDDRFKDEAYICPLSLKIHTKEGLSRMCQDQLTIEHVPPESLKGKAICLTNKIANSQSGHSLDLSLLKHINLRDFNEGLAPYNLSAYFDGVKVKSSIDLKDPDKPAFLFNTSERHLGNERIEKKIKAKEPFKLSFKILKDDSNYRIAILRTAYLYAFGHLGYSLIFGMTTVINQNYELIRNQISQPDKEIVKDVISFQKNIPKNQVGVNIIYEPKEFRSLFVVFEVETATSNWRYGVFLPGPDDYGFMALCLLKDRLNQGGSITFKSFNIPRLDLTDRESCLEYYQKWEKFNGIYKV